MFFSCNQAIQLNTKYANTWNTKGNALEKLGKY